MLSFVDDVFYSPPTNPTQTQLVPDYAKLKHCFSQLATFLGYRGVKLDTGQNYLQPLTLQVSIYVYHKSQNHEGCSLRQNTRYMMFIPMWWYIYSGYSTDLNSFYTYNWYPSKVHFRATVKTYAITLARKWTFDGQQLFFIETCDAFYDERYL